MEITGPTQKDLIIKSNSNYELVSRAISGRSVGDFIGAIFGGFLVDKLEQYCDLMIALSLDLAAISTIIAPYCRDISLLWFSFVFSGISEAIINIGKYFSPIRRCVEQISLSKQSRLSINKFKII